MMPISLQTISSKLAWPLWLFTALYRRCFPNQSGGDAVLRKRAGAGQRIGRRDPAGGQPLWRPQLSFSLRRALAARPGADPAPGNALSAIIPFTRTAAREQQFRWLAELFLTQSRFYSYQRPAPIASLATAKAVKIGLVRGHALVNVLQSAGVMQLDQGATDAGNNVRKLYHQRFDTIADSDLIVRYHWNKMDYPANALLEGAPIGPPTRVYLATGLHFPEPVAQRIQQAMARLQASGELEQILARWHYPE